MSDKEKKFSIKWLDKLKNIKHIEVYISILFIVILLLIFMPNLSSKKTNSSGTSTSNELSVISYVDNLEKNLEEILTKIEGVTNVKVLITLNMKQAEVEDSLIKLSSFPEIKGVIITGNGLQNTAIKMKVLHAVEAVIEVTNENIEILSSN